ncbi:MAG: tetratricopeptide repeat protein [Bacteroidales bacterium]|jgi:thioredoxin-like negative regulator of GroEL|nr:tetratricopeptide repeat protein [Bacteroidales bacterium]
MIKKICFFVCLLPLWHCEAQILSDVEVKSITTALDRSIKEISAQNTDNLSLIHVYGVQIQQAETTLEKYKLYKDNAQIATKWLCLKTLAQQNKEIINFIEQNLSQRFYTKGINALYNNKNQEAAQLFQKAIDENAHNVMANYQIANLKLDSNNAEQAINILYSVLETMKPSEDERVVCMSLLSFAYNKTMVQSLAMMKEGKFADAQDMLAQLRNVCPKDKYGVCNEEMITANIEKCKTGVYNDHLSVTKRALDMGKTDIAADFIASTFDYLNRNQEDIKATRDFDQMAQSIIGSYIKDAKRLTNATQYEARIDVLKKAKALAEMVGGSVETKTLKDIAAIEGTTSLTDSRLDSIEDNTPSVGYSDTYAQYVNDTLSDSQTSVSSVEKDYIATSNNKLPKKSVAVEQTKTQSLSKELDDKFFEVRSFITVNNYEKALEVLESANRLARIDKEKKEVEKMYLAAIREITARRMSAAEYAIFQGDIPKADSLVAVTQDLIATYKMGDDFEVKRIMNSYLLALDRKVCDKKQEEIDVYVNNTLNCINKNDFYAANQNIEKAMQIKGSSQCRLDKTRIRALKRQIEKPLEYVDLREKVMDVLDEEKDTMKFIFGYAGLEQFYIDNYLVEMRVKHEPLRSILHSWGDDKLVIKSIEYLMKYRKFEVSLSLVGALKDFGYKTKHTKDIQQKLGEMMALDNLKNAEKIEQYHRVSDLYQGDSWFKSFNKSYNKNYEKWKKENKFFSD